MPYKSILLYLEDTPSAEASQQLAVKLARDHEAHLTGLVVGVEPTVPTYGYHPMLIEALEVQRQAIEEEARALAQTFSRQMEQEGLAADSRVEIALPGLCSDTISRHARYSDLVIMSQPDPDNLGPMGRHLPEHVILGCGCPVLVVPYIGVGGGAVNGAFGKRILVGWNSSREASRAIRDALPLLTRADEVNLLVVKPETGPDAHGEDPGADIALHLARQGCRVEVHIIKSTNLAPEEAILSSLTDFGADALVMGAYGHARLRELALGGATQHILEHMTVPVLMSH